MKFSDGALKKDLLDKSLLIEKVWNDAKYSNQYICMSRPRRFGKSTDAAILSAFFSKGCDFHSLFKDLKVAGWDGYKKYLNQYHVIFLNMQYFLGNSKDIADIADTSWILGVFSGCPGSIYSES